MNPAEDVTAEDMTAKDMPTKDTPAEDTPADATRGRPISNGPNDRSRDETISSTGPGLPDDDGRAVEITPEEEKRIADKILKR